MRFWEQKGWDSSLSWNYLKCEVDSMENMIYISWQWKGKKELMVLLKCQVLTHKIRGFYSVTENESKPLLCITFAQNLL